MHTAASIEAFVYGHDRNAVPQPGGGWKCRCINPAHQDKSSSMKIKFDQSTGRVLVKCFVDCAQPGELLKMLPALDNMQEKHQGKKVSVFPAPSNVPFQPKKHPKLDRMPDVTYIYTDEKGRLCFVVCRWNALGDQQKDIRPMSVSKASNGQYIWSFSLQGGKGWKRPLYNVRELVDNPAKVVLVVEGEKTANAARELYPDMVVVSYQGGGSSWHHSDWSPITGRSVILCPDNDHPTRVPKTSYQSMQALAQHLQVGDAVTDIRLWRVPDSWPHSWDLADAVPEGGSIPSSATSLGDFIEEKPFKPAFDEWMNDLTEANYMALYNEQYYRYSLNHKEYSVSKAIVKRSVGRPFMLDQSNTKLIGPMHEAYHALMVDTKEHREDSLLVWARTVKHDQRIIGKDFFPYTLDPVVEVDGYLKFNSFRGFLFEPDYEARCPEFDDFILNVICAGSYEAADYLWNWMATMFQAPWEKCSIMILLQGKQGTGKGTLLRILNTLLGGRSTGGGYCQIIGTTADLFAKTGFVSHLFNSILLIGCEEFHSTKSTENLDSLKSKISDESIMVNEKFVTPYQTANLTRFLGCTNHEHALKIPKDDRRTVVLEVSDIHARDTVYRNKLWAALQDNNNAGLKAVMGKMMSYKIDLLKLHEPLENKAKKAQQAFTANIYEDVLRDICRHQHWDIVKYDDEGKPYEKFREPDNWETKEISIPCTLLVAKLERLLAKNPRKYDVTAIKWQEFAKLCYPPGEPIKRSSVHTYVINTTSTMDSYSPEPRAAFRIPRLEQVRLNFCANTGYDYVASFGDNVAVLEDYRQTDLPDLPAPIAIIVKDGDVPF